MRFTEPELTAAVDGVARHVFSVTRPPWRRRGTEAAWDGLAPVQKYQRRSAVGEVVLPALQELPERPTVGARPHFEDDEYTRAAEAASRALMEHRRPGAWDAMPERRRRRLVRGAAAMTRQAVAHMPVRRDPDDLVAPDHL